MDNSTYIRRASLKLDFANTNKLATLDSILVEYKRVVNEFIDLFWDPNNISKLPKFSKKRVETWLSVRLQQQAGKVALQNIRSQIKKSLKVKPTYEADTMDLDERFWNVVNVGTSFDIWIKLGSIGRKVRLVLPTKKHSHFNRLAARGKLLKSSRIRKTDGRWFIDVFFEIEAKPTPNSEIIGADIGVKKLLADSEGKTYGSEIESIIIKLQRKQKNSKNYKRALQHKKTEINRICNEFARQNIGVLIVEDLKNLKKNTKKRLRKDFRSKLHYWNYAQVLRKLESLAEDKGFGFIRVDPAYTSQTCSGCGYVDKSARKGEVYRCSFCGLLIDADINASINIRNRGAYSPPVVRNKPL